MSRRTRPLTNLEEALRPLTPELMAKGQLPRGALSRMWGGNGTGQLCSLCDKAIERYQIEYEVSGRRRGRRALEVSARLALQQ